jgi:hypothetical protein
MKNIINLCRLAIIQLNSCNLPPYSLKKTKQGNTVICSGSGSYIARIWENGICDQENAEMMRDSMNNNFRFAAALAIAVEKLQSLGVTEMPEIDNCFSGELDFKQLGNFEH